MFLELVALNFLVWCGGLLCFKGMARNYLLILVFIFSGSYWLPVIFFDDGRIDANILIDYVPASLQNSIVAGLFFYAGLFLRRKKAIFLNLHSFFHFNLNRKAVPSYALLMIKLMAFINGLSILGLSINDIGAGDRVYFLDELKPFWYFYLLPLNSFLIVAWIYTDSNAVVINSIRRDWLLWVLVILHIALVGFDGSRRQALLPLLFIFVKVVIYNISLNNSFFKFNRKTFLLVLLVFFSMLMTLNRAFVVGWGIFQINFFEYFEYIPTFFQLLLSSSPTVHVNTQMLALIHEEGAHGYGSYFRALGNFLFPKFIFHKYFFGEPLVLELHERFGWYGQDFGFMAEAIYSGGLFGVAILHFLYGLLVATALNGYASKKYSFFYKILSVFIIFGAINSLRSDFMNLLKATFYPVIGILILRWVYVTSKKYLKRG